VGLTNLSERQEIQDGQRSYALGAKKRHATGFHISENGCELMLFEHPAFARSPENIRQRVPVPDKEVKT
jgi:hypothetical protein